MPSSTVVPRKHDPVTHYYNRQFGFGYRLTSPNFANFLVGGVNRGKVRGIFGETDFLPAQGLRKSKIASIKQYTGVWNWLVCGARLWSQLPAGSR